MSQADEVLEWELFKLITNKLLHRALKVRGSLECARLIPIFQISRLKLTVHYV